MTKIKVNVNLKPTFPLYFLNTYISIDIEITEIQFLTHIKNIHMEGTYFRSLIWALGDTQKYVEIAGNLLLNPTLPHLTFFFF